MESAEVDEEAVADALEILDEIQVWRLAPRRWDQVSELLDQMASTIDRRDATAVLSAVADLQRNGPTRVQRIGVGAIAGIPESITDRCNALTRALVRLLRTDEPEAGRARKRPS
ncbi:CATRA system-associated protein [Actinoplanes sp. NPDC051411]|uniref:CATRA system-associated protein n=1 Tax=Actinoplanes sp. NPDC051411 TaxID=3155522 RepID=UPI0034373D77